MSGTVNYSVSLEKQATWVIYKESPSSNELSTLSKYVDNSSFEEYSYTGSKSEIEAQKAAELASAGSYQVQTTMTRLNGNLWELRIRKAPVKTKVNEEVTPEEQAAQENKYGSKTSPKQTSINITAIQESILNHPTYASVPPDNLGAIKMYMNGAGGGEKIGTSSGVVRLDSLMHLTDDLVQMAIKNPTYYVPSMTVTYQYWSAQKVTDMSEIGKPKSPPGVVVPDGFTSLFMGSSSSPAERGYTIQESYLIGKFNEEVYKDKN